MEYEVHRAGGIFKGDGTWDGAFWKNIPGLKLKNHMGDYPVHFPETRAKLCYDDLALYLIFQVRDQYVRAVAGEDQGRIWEDSCVEFFFTPQAGTSAKYFNLEMNCSGRLLFHYHPHGGETRVPSVAECRRIRRYSSLPGRVDPEIPTPITWTLAVALSLELVARYSPMDCPGPGVSWRANFYKCGDETSHPHWLTWAPVDFPRPNFHLPEFFGKLRFQ